ncbi:hypothetical protein [Nocardia cyriacigeorgica]|uniref:hypothetical protein n=1 Tax=Nocardia cyriacigeorgica TaxID=135487 RepID=UPI002456E04C|nr:hypothetical protein [Nocardia cyriacigeorgica]
MSDVNQSRTRRRASRSAGPPVDEVQNEAIAASSTSAVDPDRSDAVEPGTAVPGSARVRGRKTDKADIGMGSVVSEADTVKLTADADTVEEGSGSPKRDAEKVKLAAADADTARRGADTVQLDADTGQPDADTVKLTAGSAASDKAADDSGSADDAGRSGFFRKKPAQAAADEDAETDTDSKSSRRSAVRMLAVAASTIVALALVAGAVISVFAVRSADERDARRAEYVQTARQTVLNLTTIRADTAKEDIDRILTMASGEFKEEFNGRVDPFTEVVKQAKVQSTGEVVEAALESEDDDSARVLIAAKQTVINAGKDGPQQRYYRFRVTVTDTDAGMTVSDVEFVA